MIDVRVFESFFDRKKVIAKVKDVNREALVKAGFLIRRTTRQSMRKRKSPSAPGKPPRVVRGDIRRHTYFSYDKRSKSVVVGPARYSGTKKRPLELLEYGGVERFEKKQKPSRRKGRKRRGARRQSWNIPVEARPYMAPALEKNRPKIPRLWRGSIRG